MMVKNRLNLKSILYIAIFVLLWVFNLFNGTSLGTTYHTNELLRGISIIVLVALFFNNIKKDGIYVYTKNITVFGGLFLLFFIVSLLNDKAKDTFNYLYVYLLIFLLSQMDIDEFTVKLTGVIYGVLGASILYIFSFGSMLNGWNENSIAMIGMHSFLVFLIPFYKTKKIGAKLLLVVATIAFAFLVSPTDSRSCILFGAIAVLLAISVLPKGIVIRNRLTLVIWLLGPLIIAIIVSIISGSDPAFLETLNDWSLRNFDKPVFNGRDELWISGFDILFKNIWNFFFGTVNYSGNWHNVAISCLVAFGSIGYLVWLYSLYYILKKSFKFFGDYIVVGCVLSFVIITVQQSVELGMFSSSPNLLPYVILGVLMGRIKKLKGEVIRSENYYTII